MTDEELVVKDFLSTINTQKRVESFCYLLLTEDPQCNEEAVRRIKENFAAYRRAHGIV